MNDTPHDEPETANRNSQRTVLIVLTVALLAWGAYHATGSFFGGFGGANLRQDFRRSLVIFGFMVAFLAFWWGMILFAPKKARTKRRN